MPQQNLQVDLLRIASRPILCQPRGRLAFDSFRDFVKALDRAGELKRIAQPVATELKITRIAATENELKEERAMVADLLPT